MSDEYRAAGLIRWRLLLNNVVEIAKLLAEMLLVLSAAGRQITENSCRGDKIVGDGITGPVYLMAATYPVLPRFIRLPTLVMLCLFAISPAQADGYSPMFSEDMLATLDPATRERFAALEDENYRRWRNRNPQQPDVAAAQRQHRETEAMLERFAESRRLQDMSKRRASESSLAQQQKCAAVAAEIEELTSGGLFYETDKSGERRYLSDKEVSNRVKSQQKSYNKYCKG